MRDRSVVNSSSTTTKTFKTAPLWTVLHLAVCFFILFSFGLLLLSLSLLSAVVVVVFLFRLLLLVWFLFIYHSAWMRAMSMTSCLLRCSVCWLLHRTTTYYYYCGHYTTTIHYTTTATTHTNTRERARVFICVVFSFIPSSSSLFHFILRFFGKLKSDAGSSPLRLLCRLYHKFFFRSGCVHWTRNFIACVQWRFIKRYSFFLSSLLREICCMRCEWVNVTTVGHCTTGATATTLVIGQYVAKYTVLQNTPAMIILYIMRDSVSKPYFIEGIVVAIAHMNIHL